MRKVYVSSLDNNKGTVENWVMEKIIQKWMRWCGRGEVKTSIESRSLYHLMRMAR